MDEEKDVKKEESSPSPESTEENVGSEGDNGDDKDKNFAKLRDKNRTLEEENKKLQKDLEDERKKGEGGDRSLTPKDKEEAKSESGKDLDRIFERDKKEATLRWNKDNKIDNETWGQIQSKVVLTGEETISEIYDKIDEVYHSIPSVRKKREKDLIEQGKKEAVKEFLDDELDLGTGGEEIDLGEGGSQEPRLTAKEKKWVKGLGVKKEALKNIDRDRDPAQWEVLDPNYKE